MKSSSNSFSLIQSLGLIGTYCLAFAGCGWLVLIANFLGISGKAGWIFPVVNDLPGLIASVLFLLVVALTPFTIRQLFNPPGKGPRE